MNDTKPESFAVLQFSLEVGTDGRPGQQVLPCGVFGSVDAAFAVARSHAVRARDKLMQMAHTGGKPSQVEFIPTEWGYDIRQDFLVVTRFWVHDRAPASAPAVS